MSEVLRFDLKRHGIGVSLVVPGGVKTPLVETVQIAGIDRQDPRVQKLTRRFEKHAVTPEKVADCILAGIVKKPFPGLHVERHPIRILVGPEVRPAVRVRDAEGQRPVQFTAVAIGRGLSAPLCISKAASTRSSWLRSWVTMTVATDRSRLRSARQRDDLPAAFLVEGRRGLVDQEHRGVVDE